MERSEILATMGELKLYGMKAAFDEIIASAVKRQHEPQRVVGDLLAAEIAEKQARSIKYQIGGNGLVVEGAGFEFLDPDADQVARQVMSTGEAMERLARQVILRHLALELDPMGAVSGHGLPPFESPAPRSIARRHAVRLKGCTPVRMRSSPAPTAATSIGP